MLTAEEWVAIRELAQRKVLVSQIARRTGHDRKTVRRALAEMVPKPNGNKGKVKQGKLEPFREYLLQRIAQGRLNGTVLLEEITGLGYTGKTSILSYFLIRHRLSLASSGWARWSAVIPRSALSSGARPGATRGRGGREPGRQGDDSLERPARGTGAGLSDGPEPVSAKMSVFLRPKLLVIDEVGYLPAKLTSTASVLESTAKGTPLPVDSRADGKPETARRFLGASLIQRGQRPTNHKPICHQGCLVPVRLRRAASLGVRP